MYVFLYICLSLGIIGYVLRLAKVASDRSLNEFGRTLGIMINVAGLISHVILIVLFASR